MRLWSCTISAFFLANEAADEYHRNHGSPDNKYHYSISFSTAIRTGRKYFLHCLCGKHIDIIRLLCRFVHAVKEQYRQFARPLRGIGAIRFNYR